ncbi:hypothetical protein ALC62_11233 [Cyphomyrmex costatus]|uniref:Uncharacterized protein n=1 Tax=Cyphomyrmex costatus TaxID=456900 RepID=A0A195CAP6_9HYME|nr:hypothetical protein ALC62_11233 [Cyphomyrmex costatus]
MEKLCPICEKNGVERRLKAFQISLEEAVWSCESVECSWPIGYEELTFFPRSAFSIYEEEPSLVKEDMSVLECEFYTPPITPPKKRFKEMTEATSAEYSSCPTMEDKMEVLSKCELIASTKESTISNELFDPNELFNSLELKDINSKESRSIPNKQSVIVRARPKIINVEKININLKICSNIEHNIGVNRTLLEHNYSRTDTDEMETSDISNNEHTEFKSAIHTC